MAILLARIFLWLCAVLLAALIVAPTFGGIDLSTVPGIAQLIAFPRAIGLLLIIACVLLVWKAAKVRWSALTLALLSLVLVALPVAPVTSPAPTAAEANAGERFTVVSYNSKHTFTAADFDALNARFQPDIIVLPEADRERAEIALRGSGFKVFTGADTATSVAVRSSLSGYGPVDAPQVTFGALALEAENLPTVIGVHAAPPLPDLMDEWEADLDYLEDLNPQRPTIVAGDFNATLRHGAFAQREEFVDAFQECGIYQGTWPTALPSALRTPIDHVFVTPDLQVLRCEAVEVGRSDHMAIAVTVRLP